MKKYWIRLDYGDWYEEEAPAPAGYDDHLYVRYEDVESLLTERSDLIKSIREILVRPSLSALHRANNKLPDELKIAELRELGFVEDLVSGNPKTVTEKCMFCATQIEVPEPNVYAVICAPCRQQAYTTADKLCQTFCAQCEKDCGTDYLPLCKSCYRESAGYSTVDGRESSE